MYGNGNQWKSDSQLVSELRSLVASAVNQNAFNFIGNLAIHARTEMQIRAFPVIMVVEFAKALRAQNKKYANLRQLVTAVIDRADQITELYAYALHVFGDKKSIPTAIKRGVADAFNKFDRYQFAKYNRSDALKFRDVLRIVHPVAKDSDQGAIFQQIMTDTLPLAETWETALSINGQKKGAEKLSDKTLWEGIIASEKMGYMATLRNLRNISEARVGAQFRDKVLSYLTNPVAVSRSRQLPFDFAQAYNELRNVGSSFSSAVAQAMDLSVANLPMIGERIWVIVDFSGSMGSDSDPAIQNATLFAAALIKSNNDAERLAVTLFGSNAKTLRRVDNTGSVFTIQSQLLAHRRGGIAGSTNFRAALQEKSKLGFEPDTVVVITDGEVNSFPYSEIRTFQKNAVRVTINMDARPSTPMSAKDGWFAIAGWSTALLKWIPAHRKAETVVEQLSNAAPTWAAAQVQERVQPTMKRAAAAKPTKGDARKSVMFDD
jgi:hypothetical protein